MPPQTRRSTFPRVVIERDTDSEESSSEEEEEEEVAEEENGGKLVEEEEEEVFDDLDAKKKGKSPITISLKKVCKVCKRTGHEAGFKGATYIDCPMKPCFLCKMPGHTTMSCPHRVAIERGVIPSPCRNTQSSLDYIFERQIRTNIAKIKTFVIPDQVDCAVIRYHSRRVTCLEFHPTNDNILLSGDKKGQLGVWDFHKVHEKTVYGNIHSCILNNMRRVYIWKMLDFLFNPSNDGTVYAASSDGTVSCIDLETGMSFQLMDLNPDGWQGPSSWRMLYGMDINSDKGLVLVADNFGYLYSVDMRSNCKMEQTVLIHKKGTKVVGLHCNPVQPEILLSCGNDHFARIWDMRQLEAGSSLKSLPHSRVVNSAYFSPNSGSKILTTSQDNRLRVWDSIFANLDSPSREIVHSHDFNRHLTPFKAEWDPKDPSESLAVIGRYISENYNGAALHPIDLIDTSTGQLVAEVMDPNITTISPVNKLHPRDDVMATGSSRSLFIWRPKEKSELIQEKDERRIVLCGRADGKKRSRKFGGESDDDSDDDKFSSKKGKNSKSKKPEPKSRSLTKVKTKVTS
ncbi:WD40 repeat [Macleaya cordata]|uniref:WD40 repeat n=1 Tax=Macleaya cordata TaxID=56857 RepID=A0A200PWV9_MACCD|nr:WD40 repeat [Macleaya cordata]